MNKIYPFEKRVIKKNVLPPPPQFQNRSYGLGMTRPRGEFNIVTSVGNSLRHSRACIF